MKNTAVGGTVIGIATIAAFAVIAGILFTFTDADNVNVGRDGVEISKNLLPATSPEKVSQDGDDNIQISGDDNTIIVNKSDEKDEIDLIEHDRTKLLRQIKNAVLILPYCEFSDIQELESKKVLDKSLQLITVLDDLDSAKKEFDEVKQVIGECDLNIIAPSEIQSILCKI